MESTTAPTTLLFVRHAQTKWNKEHRYAGSSEVPLAPEADGQIRSLTERLRHMPIKAIYSSPLSRCQITIGALSRILNLPIQIREELKERNLGTWEGKSPDELLLHHSGYHFPDSAYNGEFRITGAEPLEDLEDRVRCLMKEITQRHAGETVVVATHAGIIWIMQKRIVKNPPNEMAWPGNCSLHTVIAEDQHFVLGEIEPGL